MRHYLEDVADQRVADRALRVRYGFSNPFRFMEL
jgi:hypothetical protein